MSGDVGSKISKIYLSKLMPSMVTLMALCLGVTSIRYAMDAKWSIAVSLVLFAAILDGIDGRLARLLNSSSRFGAELDSLSDMVSFGVAPALITYFWSLHAIEYKGVGWAFVLFFIACAALRLARFNAIDSVASDESDIDEEHKSGSQFTGVPMPAGALLVLMPLIATFDFCFIDNIFPWFMGGYMALIGILMISKIPTFSGKDIQVDKKYVPFIMLLVALCILSLIIYTWIFLVFVGVVYLITLPIYAFSICRR